MRADRLLTIVLLLQAHYQLTSRDLAARLEVSERTIHRDMEALSGAGIPVVAERGTEPFDTLLDRLSMPRTPRHQELSDRRQNPG